MPRKGKPKSRKSVARLCAVESALRLDERGDLIPGGEIAPRKAETRAVLFDTDTQPYRRKR